MTDFELSNVEEIRKLFRQPPRAMQVRQLVWSEAKAKSPVVLADLIRDHKEEYRASEIYRAARMLVTHGILTRADISWAVAGRGKERIHYRQAVSYVEPFTSGASRKW